MDNAGAHFSQGFHFGCLNQLGVLFNHFRNIGDGHHNGLAAAIADGAGVHIHIKGVAPVFKMQNPRVIDIVFCRP